MPIDPLATPAANIHERHIQADADLARRVAVLERRPSLAFTTDWQDAELVNGFTNVGAPHPPASFYRNGHGQVFMRGRVHRGPTTGSASIFDLPEGFRPGHDIEFPVAVHPEFSALGLGTLRLLGSSLVVSNLPAGTDDGLFFNLDVVTFRAAE